MKTKTGKAGARLGAVLLSLCLIVGLLPVTAFAGGTGSDAHTKAFVKAVFSNAVETTGADSQICAATVKDESGDFELHYVYSPDSIWNVQLFDKVRDGLAEPYKSLIPELEKDDNDKKGFLFLSDDQYEDMELDWADPAAVAEALVPGSGTVTTQENTSSVSSGTSTDIIEDYCSDYDEKAVEFINEVGESITRPAGANTIEAIYSAVKGGPYYIIEDGIMKECNDVVIYGYVSQISAYTATKEEEGTAPIKRDTYSVYAENVINGGSDSQVYANTVTVKRDGYDGDEILVLHYVYSPNAIHSNELMEKIRAGLSEPYKSLVPTFEEGDYNRGFLRVSQDQEKYESMDLDWGNVGYIAASLTPNRVIGISFHNNSDTAISVTDISVIHDNEKVVSEKQLAAEDFYTNPPELGQLGKGEDRVEAMVGVTYRTETVEDKAYYDVFNTMHVAQIYAQGAVSVDKITPASDPITLPVRVLEDEGSGYVSRPDLTAAFTPDTAVTVGEFNEFQGLAIDYYYPMVDAELSEGYDIQAGYTVSIPLENYEGTTLSGTLTIPLPQGYDGATARIKGGASASSYTATTVTFPLTLDVSGNTAEAFELLIEYKEAQEPVVPDAPVIIKGANGTWQKGGKKRLLLTLKYLWEKTDEEHPVTLKEIGEYLQQNGIETTRKTLQADINLLTGFGIDIICNHSTQNQYHIGERVFEVPEVKLLVDAVQSARFITAKKSKTLIKKLSLFVGEPQADILKRHLYVDHRLKAGNEGIYFTVDLIHQAIRLKKRVTFQYYYYTPNKKKELKHNGKVYVLLRW